MILQALLEGGWKDEEKDEEKDDKSDDKDIETTEDGEESSENQLIQSALKSQTVSSSCLIDMIATPYFKTCH